MKRIQNEKLVCEIWATVQKNYSLTSEMLRNINNIDDDGGTLLHFAAYNADAQAMQKLLEYGVDPSVRDNWNETVADVLRMNINEEPQKAVLECLQVLHSFSA